MKNSLLLVNFILVVVSIFSCQPDDGNNFTGPPPRERGPQAIVDDSAINGFLENYTFNDIDFQDESRIMSHDSIKFYRVKDSTGAKVDLTPKQLEHSSGISLKAIRDSNDSLRVRSFTVTEGNQSYQLNYLVIREGEGKEISKSDDFYIKYEGSVIGTASSTAAIQDEATVSIAAEPFDTTNSELRWINGFRRDDRGVLTPTTIPGFYETLAKFKTATSSDINMPCEVVTVDSNGNNSIVNQTSFGIGVMIIPSGLGFYQASPGSIPAYSNLIFTFDIVNNQYNDSDNDGINDFIEGVNEGRDSDNDGNQDFNDNDDDNDGRLTRNELVFIEDKDTIDADCDGIVNNDVIIDFTNTDYLNKEVKGEGGIIEK